MDELKANKVKEQESLRTPGKPKKVMSDSKAVVWTFQTIISTVLIATVYFLRDTAITVIQQGKTQAAQAMQISVNSVRLDRIEDKGSAGLLAHEREDNARIVEIKMRLDKLEVAIQELRSLPGELKAINVRLDLIHEALIVSRQKEIKP